MNEINDKLKIRLYEMRWYDMGYCEYDLHGRLCQVFLKHPKIPKGMEARWCVKACISQDKKVRFQIDWRKTPLSVNLVNVAIDSVIEFLKEVKEYGYCGDVNNWV